MATAFIIHVSVCPNEITYENGTILCCAEDEVASNYKCVSQCPEEEHYGSDKVCRGPIKINNVSYFVQRKSLSYYDAVENCKHVFGPNTLGKIFEPRDFDTATEVLTRSLVTLSEDYLSSHIWLGIHDMNYDDDYNGLSFSYESGGTFDSDAADWNSGEPIMQDSGESCVQAIYNLLGRWKVMSCSAYPAQSVCEIEVEKGMTQ